MIINNNSLPACRLSTSFLKRWRAPILPQPAPLRERRPLHTNAGIHVLTTDQHMENATSGPMENHIGNQHGATGNWRGPRSPRKRTWGTGEVDRGHAHKHSFRASHFPFTKRVFSLWLRRCCCNKSSTIAAAVAEGFPVSFLQSPHLFLCCGFVGHHFRRVAGLSFTVFSVSYNWYCIFDYGVTIMWVVEGGLCCGDTQQQQQCGCGVVVAAIESFWICLKSVREGCLLLLYM